MNAHSNSFGSYQSALKVGNRVYLGLGHTPAEARRNAIEAADARLNNPVFSFLSFGATMKTEPCKKEWKTCLH